VNSPGAWPTYGLATVNEIQWLEGLNERYESGRYVVA
jgi:hypothetical protein